MAAVNEKDWAKQLHAEGFEDVYVWEDAPDTVYPDHTHAEPTAHVILEGEMTSPPQGRRKATSRATASTSPANTVHSAKTGPEGCKYLVGEP